MAYGIFFVGLADQANRSLDPLTSGYQARIWLPAYDEQSFASEQEATDWVIANAREDVALVNSVFDIREFIGTREL